MKRRKEDKEGDKIMKENLYEVRIMLDGNYYVKYARGLNNQEAIEYIESSIAPAKEYKVLSVEKLA
jgi:hypothetical protein